MKTIDTSQYRYDSLRYQKYYRNLSRFYQRPVAQVSTALLLTLFTVIFFGMFAILPTMETISQLIRKIDDQKAVLSDLDKKVIALSQVQNEYTLILNDIPYIYSAVPKDVAIQQFLITIESIAASHNVVTNNLTLDSFSYGNLETKSDEVNNQIKLNLSLSGNFPTLNQIVQEIQNSSRLITIDGLKYVISQDETGQEISTDPQVTLSLSLKAFFIPKKIVNQKI